MLGGSRQRVSLPILSLINKQYSHLTKTRKRSLSWYPGGAHQQSRKKKKPHKTRFKTYNVVRAPELRLLFIPRGKYVPHRAEEFEVCLLGARIKRLDERLAHRANGHTAVERICTRLIVCAAGPGNLFT